VLPLNRFTRFRTGSLRTTAALVETDRHKLFALVQAAEKSIFESLQEIADSPVHQVERQAIFDAHATLAFLKRDAQKP
jgi:hypothetical protein